MVNINGPTTETVSRTTKNIDELGSLGIAMLISNEDKKVALAVKKGPPSIAKAMNEIAARFKRSGRIIYCEADSPGRMGTLDAVELTPTYGVSPDRAFDLLAGGETAMYKAVEGAENSEELALEDLKRVRITKNDCVIDIAASGRTPYIISALEYANKVGALNTSITCNGENKMAKIAGISIAPVVGAEAVSGSTRVKAGTTQKMVVNMLPTTTIIRLGKVYHNYTMQVQPASEELAVRATRMIAQITGMKEDKTLATLESVGLNVPEAIVTLEGSCDKETTRKALDRADDQVRKAIGIIKK